MDFGVAPIAFVSSLAQAAPDIAETLLNNPHAPQHADLSDAYQRVLSHGVPLGQLGLPPREQFWTTFQDPDNLTPHLQKAVTKAIERAHAAAMQRDRTLREQACARSRSGPGAYLPMVTLPTRDLF